ncbi:hypothetical protein [Maribacter sp. 2307UL18-2]|uniref:hypothetical protein n=1 Tax=Maribacter sp. 2307UL18-2 TaxID=3386274 RepID=UPI0039BC3616
MSEPYNVHRELVALWIRQAVHFEGDFMVKNAGRSYLSVVKGKAVFCDNGLLTNYRRKPEVLEKILHGLVDKYHNFTHSGYYYFYSRGEWRRFKP